MWTKILAQSGIPKRFLRNKHGPCPLCGGKDRFRYDDKGKGTYFCNQCGAGDGFELLKQYHNIDFKEALRMAEENGLQGFVKYDADAELLNRDKLQKNREHLEGLLSRLVPAKGTIVETYLSHRKLELPEPIAVGPLELGPYLLKDDVYYNSITNEESKCDAMVWKMLDPITFEVVALHRTYLNSDGYKNDSLPTSKKETPRTRDAPTDWRDKQNFYKIIPLTSSDNDVIILGEGIETTLSAHAIMKHEHREDCTAIALSSSGNLAKFTPNYKRHHGKHFLIFADKDESRAGAYAAVSCLKNIDRILKGRHGNIIMPYNEGEDWNDIWVKGDAYELAAFNYWL